MTIWTIQENNGIGWVLLRYGFVTKQEADSKAEWLKKNVLPDATYKVRPVECEGVIVSPPRKIVRLALDKT